VNPRLAILGLLVGFWLGAYLVAGWTGVAVMAVAGALGELVLFRHAVAELVRERVAGVAFTVQVWLLRASVRRRIRRYQRELTEMREAERTISRGMAPDPAEVRTRRGPCHTPGCGHPKRAHAEPIGPDGHCQVLGCPCMGWDPMTAAEWSAVYGWPTR